MDTGGLDSLGNDFHDVTGSSAAVGPAFSLRPEDLQALLDGQPFLGQPDSEVGGSGMQDLSAADEASALFEGGAFTPLWPQPGGGGQGLPVDGAAGAAASSGLGGRVRGVASKPRLRWTPELHSQFLSACNSFGGPEKATPKQIQVAMAVPGLTLLHVKSHLQKYRVAIKGGPASKGGSGGNSTGKKRSHATAAESGCGKCSGDEAEEEQCGSQAALEEGQQAQRSEPGGAGLKDRSTTKAGIAAIETVSTPPLPAEQLQQEQGMGQGGAGSPEPGGARGHEHFLPLAAGEQSTGSGSTAPQSELVIGGGTGSFEQGLAEEVPGAPSVQAGRAGPGPSADEAERRQRMEQALAVQRELQGQLQAALEAQRQLQDKMLAHGRLIESLLAGDASLEHPSSGQSIEASKQDKSSARLSRSSSSKARAKASRLVLDAGGGPGLATEGPGGPRGCQQHAAEPQRAGAVMARPAPAAAMACSPACASPDLPLQQVVQQTQPGLLSECLDPAVVLARLAHGLPVHQLELACLMGRTSLLTPAQKSHILRAVGAQQLQQEDQPPAAIDGSEPFMLPAVLSGRMAPQGPLQVPAREGQQPLQQQQEGLVWLGQAPPSNCSVLQQQSGSALAAATAFGGRSMHSPSVGHFPQEGSPGGTSLQIGAGARWKALLAQDGSAAGILDPGSSARPAAQPAAALQEQRQASNPAGGQRLLPSRAGQAMGDMLLDDPSVFDELLCGDFL